MPVFWTYLYNQTLISRKYSYDFDRQSLTGNIFTYTDFLD